MCSLGKTLLSFDVLHFVLQGQSCLLLHVSLDFLLLLSSPLLPGASVRTSAHGKGHEEGGLTYAKAGSSLRSPPGNSRASTPKPESAYFLLCALTYTSDFTGAVPHHLFQRRS